MTATLQVANNPAAKSPAAAGGRSRGNEKRTVTAEPGELTTGLQACGTDVAVPRGIPPDSPRSREGQNGLGRTLDSATHPVTGSAFGHDFSRIRIHGDERGVFNYGRQKSSAESEQKPTREVFEKPEGGARPMGSTASTLSALMPLFDRKNSAEVGFDPQVVETGLASSAQPLDAATRRQMEDAFGHDFSRVRVHTDPHAAKANEALNAHAYTVGGDVVFGAGKYEPATRSGRQLLAHELAHVVQQHAGGGASRLQTAGPATAAEHEAVAAARQIDRGQRVGIRLQVGTSIQCAPAEDTGVRTQFVDPGSLTRDQIIIALLRMAYLFDTATSTSLELTDIEQKVLPRYVDSFVRLSRHDKAAPTLPGLDPKKEGHQKVLRLLPAAPADQPNFLEPPKPLPAAPVPAPKEESSLEKFAREHEREISQLPQWNQHFVDGLNATRLPGALGASWEKLKTSLTSVDTAAQFYFGFTTGVPIGAVKDIYGQFKDLVELLLKTYLFNEKAKIDPVAALRDVRQFAESLVGKVVSLFDPHELGIAVGSQLAKSVDQGFVDQDAKGQGRFIGEQVGKVLMEVALLFIGVEEVSAAAKALRGSKVGIKMAESLSVASKELKTILEIRGALKTEGKVAAAAAKEAKAAESGAKDALATAGEAKPRTPSPEPADPYDVSAWIKYYEENPHAKRSVGAAQADDPHAFTQDKGTNVPPEKPAVEVEARARGGAIERDHLDSMPEYSRPKEHDFPGIDAWKGGRDATRDTNAGRMRIISGADVLQIKSVGSSSAKVVSARVREGITGLQPSVFEKGSTRVVNPATRRLDVLFEEGALSEVTTETKTLLTSLAEEAGNSGVEVRWFRYSAGKKIRVPIP